MANRNTRRDRREWSKKARRLMKDPESGQVHFVQAYATVRAEAINNR
jgi:hypothetical protein